MLKSDYFRIEIIRTPLRKSPGARLKSDYFRIEMGRNSNPSYGPGTLKSDYFRIEIPSSFILWSFGSC